MKHFCISRLYSGESNTFASHDAAMVSSKRFSLSSLRSALSRRPPPSQNPELNLAPEATLVPSKVASIRHLDFASSLNDCALTPDGKFFCVAADFPPAHCANACEICVYEYQTSSARARHVAHTSSVLAVTISLDGATAASADYSGRVGVWKANTGRSVCAVSAHSSSVSALALTPSADVLVSGGADTVLKTWDLPTGERLRSFFAHSHSVSSCAVSLDGNDLMSTGIDANLFVWDVRQQTPTVSLVPHARKSVTSCATDRVWRLFVTCGFDGRVNLWDRRMYKMLWSANTPGVSMYGCDITGDGRRIVACGENGTLKMWDSVDESNPTELTGHSQWMRVSACAISDDALRLVSTSQDKTVHMFKLEPIAVDADQAFVPEGDTALVKIESAVKGLCNAYLNHGKELTPARVANALVSDHARKTAQTLSDIFVAHTLIKTVLKSGMTFSEELLNGPSSRDAFFYEHVYHNLCNQMPTEREKEFGRMLLADAKQIGLLQQSDVNSIIGDAQTLEIVDAKLSQLQTVFAEVCTLMTKQVDHMEIRIRSISEDLVRLRTEVDEMEREREREAKVQRWASLVKFGVGLIPIAGCCAMGFVDASAELFLSFDLGTVVGLIGDVVSQSGQSVVDAGAKKWTFEEAEAKDDSAREQNRELQAVRLAQMMISPGFLESIPIDESRAIKNSVEAYFGADCDALLQRSEKIVDEYMTVDELSTTHTR